MEDKKLENEQLQDQQLEDVSGGKPSRLIRGTKAAGKKATEEAEENDRKFKTCVCP